MKIVTIIGARPQFIKSAVISKLFLEQGIDEIVVHTGQHFDADMSDVFFEELRLPSPRYNLDIHGLSHGAMTGKMLEGIENVLIYEKPDGVLVYGDTNSTLAGALAARKLHIPVAHVEAGLRSFNMLMPEEINRILTDRISNLLFCPSELSKDNLRKEGIMASKDYKIVISGDIMYDCALLFASYAKSPMLSIEFPYLLCTIHRAENTDDIEKLKCIINTLEEISKETVVILPLHPRTRAKLTACGCALDDSPIKFISPVGYLEMIWLIDHSELVITDSGGVQKEAYYFQKPCVTLRDETEWVELVEHGYNKLVGADKENIISAIHYFLATKLAWNNNLYGDGHAGEIIVQELIESWN